MVNGSIIYNSFRLQVQTSRTGESGQLGKGEKSRVIRVALSPVPDYDFIFSEG